MTSSGIPASLSKTLGDSWLNICSPVLFWRQIPLQEHLGHLEIFTDIKASTSHSSSHVFYRRWMDHSGGIHPSTVISPPRPWLARVTEPAARRFPVNAVRRAPHFLGILCVSVLFWVPPFLFFLQSHTHTSLRVGPSWIIGRSIYTHVHA